MQVASIHLSEVHEVAELLSVTSRDTSSPTGWVIMKAQDGVRTWIASDGISILTLRTDEDDSQYAIILSAAQVFAFHLATDLSNEVEVHVEERDGATVHVLRAEGFEMTSHPPCREHPALKLNLTEIEVGATAVFTGAELRAAIISSWYAIEHENGEEGDDCFARIDLDRGKLTVFSKNGLDSTTATSYRVGRKGTASLTVNVCRLYGLVRRIDPDATVTVNFPLHDSDPVVFVGETFTMGLSPACSERQAAEQNVTKVIHEALGKLSAARNEDGDFLLRRKGTEILGKFISDENSHKLRVFGPVLETVAPSAQLFEELNQINLTSDYVKVFYVDLRVIVCCDLLASTLDAPELSNAIETVHGAIRKYSKVLSVVFGGDIADDPEVLRWREALGLVVECEITPGSMVDLNGEDGIEEWPFPTEVYVLTGYNPQGADVAAERINPQIAHDVLAAGGRCVFGSINNPEDNSNYPAIVAWNLSRDLEIEFATKVGHENLISFTADEMTLLSCNDDTQESRPRVKAA